MTRLSSYSQLAIASPRKKLPCRQLLSLQCSVSRDNVGLLKDFLAHLSWLVDVLGSLGNFLDPDGVVEAGVLSVDILKPLVLTDDLNDILVDELSDFVLRVDSTSTDVVGGKLEHVLGDELADLLENGDEVFISSRNLFMLLKATLLENAVKCACLICRLSGAV